MRCVLFHGFAGDPSAWDDVIAEWTLPDPPRVLALPGHGGGPVLPTWGANIDTIASTLGECDAAIGYSLGARVALGLLAAGRVQRAVLISVNPGISDDERPARAASDGEWARLLREHGVGAFERAWTAQPLFATQVRANPVARAARQARRLALSPKQLANSLDAMGLAVMPDYRDIAATHRARIAVIAGADDTKYVELARALPSASFELIADSGHDPTLEQPERLAAAIARAVVRLA